MTNSADVLLQAPPTHTFESSESTQKEMHQERTNTVKVCLMSIPASRTKKYGNYVSSGQGSTARNNQAPSNHNSGSGAEGGTTTTSSLNLSQTRPTSPSLALATQTTSLPDTTTTAAAVTNNDQTVANNNSEVGSQKSTTAAVVDALKISETTTSVAIPTQSTALPVTTDHIPAPENDVSNKSVINPTPVNGSETRVEENQLNDPDEPDLQQDNGNQRVELVCKRCDCKYVKDESTSDAEEWLYNDMCTDCHKNILHHISSFQRPDNHPEEEKVNSCCCC